MTAPTLSSADRTYSAKELTELTGIITRQIMEVQKHDVSSTLGTNTPLYGPYNDAGSGLYGAFSYPGVRTDMFSAFMRPRSLASVIGLRPSLMANEKIGIMTGVTDGSGTNPTGFCGTAPTGGQLKRCVQNYTFGRSFWKSKAINLAESGEYIDTADLEKRILNLNQNPNPLIPDFMARLDIGNRDTALMANELFNIGVEMERKLEKVLIRGNETLPNTTTQRGWITEFKGLERQIVTGRVDMDTLIACPAADSQVITWGSGIDATVNGRTFPQLIVDTLFGLNDMAEQMGLGGTRWVLVMPMRMFRALTRLYACQYYIAYCAGTAGNPNTQNSQEIKRFELDMWNGRYLLTDSGPVQVVFSDGILETRASGSTFTAQEMFILPVEWQGMSTLNLHYKPMDNPQVRDVSGFDGLAGQVSAVNNGMWLMTTARTGFCVEFLFAGKFRLIQDIPFLAARIDTIQYSYQAPFRSADPSDTISYVDGGAVSWDGTYSVT